MEEMVVMVWKVGKEVMEGIVEMAGIEAMAEVMVEMEMTAWMEDGGNGGGNGGDGTNGTDGGGGAKGGNEGDDG